jgi:hypothetical protein
MVKNELSIGGSLILIVAGILFLSTSPSDSTGVMLPIGLVFLFGGIIGFVALIFKSFK